MSGRVLAAPCELGRHPNPHLRAPQRRQQQSHQSPPGAERVQKRRRRKPAAITSSRAQPGRPALALGHGAGYHLFFLVLF